MIRRIDSANYELIASLLEKYRKARNRDSGIFLSPDWVDLILEGFRSGRFYGLCCDADGACKGFLEYKLGKKSGYSSMIYSINSGARQDILTELVSGLKKACPRRNLLVSELSPGISADFQRDIFRGQRFEQKIRHQMEVPVEKILVKRARPVGINFRKYNRNMDRQIVKLDERAYRGHPDEIILKILTDVGSIAPSIRIVHSVPMIFESRLSYFAFSGDELAGAVYSTKNGNELGIANIAIDPGFQGKGLGTALLSRVLSGMKAHGYGKCSLMVSEDNHAAIKLYKKFKFKLKRICPIFVYRTGQGV